MQIDRTAFLPIGAMSVVAGLSNRLCGNDILCILGIYKVIIIIPPWLFRMYPS